jgi:hypothetical protein
MRSVLIWSWWGFIMFLDKNGDSVPVFFLSILMVSVIK